MNDESTMAGRGITVTAFFVIIDLSLVFLIRDFSIVTAANQLTLTATGSIFRTRALVVGYADRSC